MPSDRCFASVTTITHSKTTCFTFQSAISYYCKDYQQHGKTTCFTF